MKSLELNEISNNNLKITKGFEKCHLVLKNQQSINRFEKLEQKLKEFGFKKDEVDGNNCNIFKNTYQIVSFTKQY